MDVTIGQGVRAPHVGRIWADTVSSGRHAIAELKGRGQATDDRHGSILTSSI
jgi:hypothetical protein